MTRVSKWVDARPEDVWVVLADPRSYAHWVVGSHDVEDVVGDWPEPGSTFTHVQGHGPVKVRDTTTVLAATGPKQLRLEVRVRPYLVAEVELTLERDGSGTCISIEEHATGGLARLAPRAATSPLLALRNLEALRRLAGMAWARAQARLPVRA